MIFANSIASPYLFRYDLASNITQQITTPAIAAIRIARSSNRLWIENGSGAANTIIREYTLVESPYSVTLNRTITASNVGAGNVFSGFFAISNTQLLAYSDTFPSNLYSLDITTTTAVRTTVWSTPVTREMIGNVLYTTSGRVIYLNYEVVGASNQYYITQRVYSTGVVEFDISIGNLGEVYRNLFQVGNGIYTMRSNGSVYRINPDQATPLTLVGSLSGGASSNPANTGHAAQRSSCITISSNPNNWDGANTAVSSGLVANYDAANTSSYSGSGTNWLDLTANNNDVVLQAGVTFVNTDGGYLFFDGAGDYGTDGNDPSLWLSASAFGSGCTVDAFVYPTGFTGNINVLDYNGNSGYRFRVNTSGQPNFIADVAAISYNSTGTIPINQWSHIAVSHGPSGGNIYINGVAQSLTGSGSGSPFDTNGVFTNALRIARFQGNTTENWKGGLAVIRLYNRALNASEILQNYNFQKWRYGLL
jgi:hypothetical protein